MADADLESLVNKARYGLLKETGAADDRIEAVKLERFRPLMSALPPDKLVWVITRTRRQMLADSW